MLKPRIFTLVFSVLVSGSILSVGGALAQATPTPTTAPTATAQPTPAPDDACPQLVRRALDITQASCELVGRNQVCYGHSTLSAAWRPAPREIKFDEPGDVEDVIEMQSLSLSPMDFVRDVWGIILLEVQAGLAVTDQQDVTMILFGDAQLEANNTLIPARVVSDTNLRLLPSTQSAVIDAARPQDALWVSGRTEAGDWVRVQFSDEPMRTGWMVATQIRLADEGLSLDDARVIDPDDEDALQLASFGPMQAFYFQSGVDDAPCEEAPNSGMIIQTPEGAAEVTFWIDEVIIQLSDTASSFIQAQPNGNLTINVLEGTVSVTALGETQSAVSGTRVRVPLNESSGAADVPNSPEPFNPADLQSLPTELLQREVVIPPPRVIREGVPFSGSWRFAWGVQSLTCPDGRVVPFESSGQPVSIAISDDGNTLTWGNPYSRVADGVYAVTRLDDNGNLLQETLTVLSSTAIRGEMVIDFATTICTLTVPFSLDFLR